MEGLDRIKLRGRGPSVVAATVAAMAAFALGIMLWLQFHQGVQPCGLCIYQRLAAILLIVLLLLGLPGSWTWRRASWIGAIVVDRKSVV